MEEGKIFGTNHPAISWQFLKHVIVPPAAAQDRWDGMESKIGFQGILQVWNWLQYASSWVCRIGVCCPSSEDYPLHHHRSPSTATSYLLVANHSGRGWPGKVMYLWLLESHLQRLTSIGKERKKMWFDLDGWPFDHQSIAYSVWTCLYVEWLKLKLTNLSWINQY